MPKAANADSTIGEVQVLKSMRTGTDKAKDYLNKLVRLTAPVMKRRGWQVGVLKEFFPPSPGLLGLNKNHGECIMIRLRHPGDETQFQEWQDILGTMVHELTHIQISAHSAEFYELMDVIYSEVELVGDDGADRSGNIAESGDFESEAKFTGKSRRLGGKFGRNVTVEERSSTAAEAAVKRLKYSSMGSIKKLGGDEIVPLSKDELRRRSLRAAERRMRDNIACGSRENEIEARDVGSDSGNSSSSCKHASSRNEWKCQMCLTMNAIKLIRCSFCTYSKEAGPTEPWANRDSSDKGAVVNIDICKPCGSLSKPEVIDLLCDNDDDDDDDYNPTHGRKRDEMETAKNHTGIQTLQKPQLEFVDISTSLTLPHTLSKWSCPRCTLVNPAQTSICAACGTFKGLLHGLIL